MAGCNRFYTLLLTLLLPVSVWAQGGDALSFTRIERDPAGAALAGAGTALPAGAAWKAFSDAAMLPFTQGKLDASVAYQRWAPETALSNNVQAGVTFKVLPKLALSAGYSLNMGTPVTSLGEFGEELGTTVKPMSHLVALGVGVGLGEKWSLGVNLRYAIDKGIDSHSGFSGDLSVAWQPIAALRVSAGVATLGTSVASEDGNKYQQPASGRLGVNWGLILAKDHAIDLMASGDVFFSGKVSGALGVQYSWRKMLFARCGYRLSSAACALPSHLGLGLGVCFHGFRLDVSYLTASKEVANTLAVGLGYNF